MKPYFTLSLLLILFASNSAIAQSNKRIHQSFNDNWKFNLGDVKDAEQTFYNDAAWRSLALPHDWSIELPFDKDSPTGNGGGALRGGMGWYRKAFTLPATAKGKFVAITFDGVYRKSEVWINGHYLGKRPYGYSSFQYELSPYLNYGNEKNIIVVKVDNSQQPNSRWYSGSGIYRNVWLTIADKVHIVYNGTNLSTSEVSEKFANISFEARILNQYEEAKDVVLTNTLYDANGKVITGAISKINQGANSVVGLR